MTLNYGFNIADGMECFTNSKGWCLLSRHINSTAVRACIDVCVSRRHSFTAW